MLLWMVLLYGLVLGSSWIEGHPPQSELVTVKQWNLLTYNFEPNAPVHDKSFFHPEGIVATGMTADQSRTFIATPRLFSGVPATVSKFSRDRLGDSPVLEAYPNWSFHSKTLKKNYNCNDPGLVSVYRVRIDTCNRLWALDAGVSRSFEDYEKTCPPRIFIFDLKTNKVVRRIDFPHHVIRSDSLFTNLIIDASTSKPENKCDDVYVYVADTVEPAIVVYDGAGNLSWRVSHPTMYPNPDLCEIWINEDKFVLMDGILGLGFNSKAGILYYHQLATNKIFSVSKAALRAGPVTKGQQLPVKLVGTKSSQGATLGVSQIDGTIFFSPFTETAVVSWNPYTKEEKLLAYDPEALQFVADTFLPSSDPSGIYILSSRFHKFFLKNIDPHVVNIRILRIDANGYKPTSHLFHPATCKGGCYASLHQFSQAQRFPYPFFYNNENFGSTGQSFQYEAPDYSNIGRLNFDLRLRKRATLKNETAH